MAINETMIETKGLRRVFNALLQNLFNDLRYAWRQLYRAPGFATTVVLALSLNVGLATAVFCVIDNVMLRPLPYMHPEKIVTVDATSRDGAAQLVSWPSYQDERTQAHAFVTLACYINYAKVVLETSSSGPVSFASVESSDNLFQALGVRPLLGRTFLPGEEQDGENDIVVLSYNVWQSYFGGRPNIVNKAVKLDGRLYTVIGVMPDGFRFPLGIRNAVYTPLHLDKWWMKDRSSHWLNTVARLQDSMSTNQAQADLTHVFSDLGRTYVDTDAGRAVQVQPLAQSVTGKIKGPLWTLVGAVLAVLAIGCVNIAGLLLARGVKRQKEMTIRVAMGASRRRLIGQVLTEGMLFAALGAFGGMWLAIIMLALMRTFLIKALARGTDIHINWIVLGAAITLSVIASLAASLFPATRLSGSEPNRALKTGGRSGTERGQHRLRSGFVITQVALTLVLLIVAGMLIRLVTRYQHANLGFDSAHILTLRINLSPDRYQGRDMLAAFYRPLEVRVSHLPGVTAVGLINLLPIELYRSNSEVHIAGQPRYPLNQKMLAEGRIVSAGYFDVMGISLHRGRELSSDLDRSQNSGVPVVVNEAFVRKFIPPAIDPTTQRIDSDQKPENWDRIVGVTSNVSQNIYGPPLPELDWLMDSLDPKVRSAVLANMFLVVRTAGDPTQVIHAVRASMHELDPAVPFDEPETMIEVISKTLVFERLEGWLFGIFAGLALALALVGLYGLISHEVEQARWDIGMRMALGATRLRILSMVLRRVAWILGTGVVAGVVLTVLVRKLIGMVIYFDTQSEVGGIFLLALLMVFVGLLAALLPAARAASIEPIQAIRSE